MSFTYLHIYNALNTITYLQCIDYNYIFTMNCIDYNDVDKTSVLDVDKLGI